MKTGVHHLLSLSAALLLAPTLVQSSWQTVDDYQLTPLKTAAVAGTAATDNGVVFSASMGSNSTGLPHGFIRRSLDGGQSWLNVLDLPGSSSANCLTTTVGSLGLVFAAGRFGAVWIARRRTDGGNTWTTVDRFQPSAPIVSHAYGIASDANGSLYATGGAGITVNKVTKTHWTTRKSANGGATWRTVDDVASGSFNCGRAVTVDAFGRVFAAAQVVIGNTSHWITRGSTDGDTPWVTTDDYAPSGPRGAASDAVGNVFMGGQANGADGAQHVMVRKLAAP